MPNKNKTVYLIASGDLRLAANQTCQPAQAALEKDLTAAINKLGYKVLRAHPYDRAKKHGFIDSQKYGMEVFRDIPPYAPLIVAEAVWQYSHHVLAGLTTHRGPILTVANWSGTWPGLVGMLNLNGSLTKAGVKYRSLWSEDFTDEFFLKGLRSWLKKGKVKHDTSHARPLRKVKGPSRAMKLGRAFAEKLKRDKVIMGVFDEGCMGMYNAIIPDELLHATGVFKERLSQSALYAKTLTVKDEEARAVYDWLLARGMTFHLGQNEETELTEAQILLQCKTYIAAVRIAAEFGAGAIGIQYQQGLKDLLPASDLAEGLLNNVERPPVYDERTGKELFKGEALPHFNEVDECAGIDGIVTYKIWRELGYPPENTLHDIRWGRHYKDSKLDAYVWVFLISGAAPPAHFIDGYKGTTSERQPVMYFRLGGGTVKGISKPGWIVWSRVYVEDGRLKFDTGLGEIVKLPQAETDERWKLTTPQWPIMHAVLQGVSRDQMMARHKSNHIQVVYAPGKAAAKTGLFAKAAAMDELGLDVAICGKNMSQFASEKINALLKLSHDLGREDRGLAVLGEGNTSCRLDEDTFLVKASGSSLAGLQETQLVACQFSALLPLLETDGMTDAEVEKALLASRVNPAQPKPSVEAVFHAYLLTLPGIEVVGHTHPVAVNQILCAGDGPSRRFALERRFPDEIVCCGARSVLVPYVDPGTVLAQAIRRETEKFILAENCPPRVILLQNHGFIALGATAGSVFAATLMAEKAAQIFAGASALGGPVALTPQNVARIDTRPDEHYRQRMLKT